MRSVTKQAIREARLKEIKEELLHSEKLKVRASLGAVLLKAGQALGSEKQRAGQEAS